MAAWSPESVALTLSVIIAAIATAAVKIIAALQGVSTKVDALEIKVDGRLTQLLERTASSSRAEGVVAGRGETAAPVSTAVTDTVEGDHIVVPIPVPTPPILLLPVVEEKEKP